MKNLVVILYFMMYGLSAVFASQIELVLYYPPGGGTDQQSQLLKPMLEKRGHDVKLTYFKSCSQAIDYMKTSKKNTFMIGVSSDFNPTGNGKCIMNADTDGIKLFTTISVSSAYLCAAPNKTITESDLWTRPLRLAISTDEVIPYYVQHWLNNTKQDHKIVVVPYSGAGPIIQAAKSGDIDLWYGAGPAARLINESTKCFGASLKNDIRNVKFIGDLTKLGDNFIEMPQYFTMWHNTPITNDVNQSFLSVMSSTEFQQQLRERHLRHVGIGTGQPQGHELEKMLIMDKIFRPLRLSNR